MSIFWNQWQNKILHCGLYMQGVTIGIGTQNRASLVALDRWSLYTGLITCKRCRDCTKLVFIDMWPYIQVVSRAGLTVQ